VVDPKGNLLSDKSVKITLMRQVWHNIDTKTYSDAWSVDSKLVPKKVIQKIFKSINNIKNFTFDIKKPGSYIVKAEASDSLGNNIISSDSFYITGHDYAPWQIENHKRITLIPNKSIYKPGEIAKILIPSPFKKTRGILTIERSGILDVMEIDLDANSKYIELKIKENYTPNIFISVILNRSINDSLKKNAKPDFRLGYTKIKVIPVKALLNVDVKLDKTIYEPGELVNVDLVVKGLDNSKAEISLWVLDEALIALSGFKIPDPIKHFFKESDLGIRTIDNRLNLVSQRDFSTKGDDAGGGGGEEALAAGKIKLRKNLKTVAYYKSDIVTDKFGAANVSFKLPDNLTSFKIIAVANSKHMQFGSGINRLNVSKDVIILNAMPEFVRVGDKFTGSITVYNNTAENGDLIVNFNTTGLNLKLPQAKIETTISSATSILVPVEIKAIAEGKAVIYVTVQLKTDSSTATDALQINIDVNRVREKIIESVSGIISSDNTRQWINLSGKTKKLNMIFTRSLIYNLDRFAMSLIDYNFNCSEQLSSKLIPYLYLPNNILTKIFKSKNKNIPGKNIDIKAIRDKILNELISRQYLDGGIKLYPNQKHSHLYVSLYLGFIIATADKSLNLPVNFKKKLSKYSLENYYRAIKGFININFAPLALYVYNSLGNKNNNLINILIAKREKLSQEGKIYLMLSLLKSDMQINTNTKLINSMMDNWYNNFNEEGATGYFEKNKLSTNNYLFHTSLVKLNSLYLLALTEINNKLTLSDDRLVKIIQFLFKKTKNSRYLSTQETGHLLIAFSNFAAKVEGSHKAESIQVKHKTNTLYTNQFKKNTINITHNFDKFSSLFALDINTSNSISYYNMNISYSIDYDTIKKTNKGIVISKTLSNVGGGENIKREDIVIVQLEIDTLAERHDVVVDDYIPAGFEYIDFSLNTTDQTLKKHLYDKYSNLHANYTDLNKNKITFYLNNLSTGKKYNYYLLKAITKGRFIIPATKAMEMYNPQIYGFSSSGYMTVK